MIELMRVMFIFTSTKVASAAEKRCQKSVCLFTAPRITFVDILTMGTFSRVGSRNDDCRPITVLIREVRYSSFCYNNYSETTVSVV